ncbi:MAG: toll/interleukin-1 receptor domain-containing protein, partial [Alphaproteobacteria bacterium]
MTKIFISYARKDGRDLAKRLYDDLVAKDHDPWMDTEAIPGGGSWSRDIEDAIDHCDVALALLSNGSFESEICRAEQIMCLDKGKRIIPLLVHEDAKRPVHLYTLNYRDFSDTANYESLFAQLLDDMLRPPDDDIPTVRPTPKHARLFNVPPEPMNFIERADELNKLRRTVIGDDTDRTIALTALQGMGGIGKSVLAAMLCNDPVVRAAFPDGIVWIAVGREANGIMPMTHKIATALGDPLGHYESEAAAITRLHKILPEKSVLLVFDDVWDEDCIKPFRIEAPQCRTLFTTRSMEVIENVGATPVQVDILSPEQALDLLAKWAGQSVDSLPDEAHEVAHECGRLPLALAMVGAMAGKNENGWARALHRLRNADLDKIKKHFDYTHATLMRALQVSVDDLTESERERYYDFAVFREETVIPASTLATWWETHGFDEFDTEDMLEIFVKRSLLRDAGDNRYTMHDLQLDFIRKQVGDDALPTLHDSLLTAFNPDGLDWPEVDNDADGYLYANLAYHLLEARRTDELHALLTGDDRWLNAQLEATASITAYVDDLNLAVETYRDPLTGSEIVRLATLWAARSVIHKRVMSYSDADLTALVWLGREQEALGYARLRTEPQKLFDGLMTIYTACKARAEQRGTGDPPGRPLLDEARQAADSILAADDRDEALSQLVAAQAQAGHFEGARETARRITDDRDRADTLSQLAAAQAQAGHSSAEETFRQASETASRITDGYSRAAALSQLAAAQAQAGHSSAEETFRQASETASRITFDWSRANALAKLAAAQAQAGHFEQARETASRITVDWSRANALSQLVAAQAQAGHFEQARETASRITSDWDRAAALRQLAAAQAQAGHSSAQETFRQARETARRITDDRDRAAALRKLAAAQAQAGHFEL